MKKIVAIPVSTPFQESSTRSRRVSVMRNTKHGRKASILDYTVVRDAKAVTRILERPEEMEKDNEMLQFAKELGEIYDVLKFGAVPVSRYKKELAAILDKSVLSQLNSDKCTDKDSLSRQMKVNFKKYFQSAIKHGQLSLALGLLSGSTGIFKNQVSGPVEKLSVQQKKLLCLVATLCTVPDEADPEKRSKIEDTIKNAPLAIAETKSLRMSISAMTGASQRGPKTLSLSHKYEHQPRRKGQKVQIHKALAIEALEETLDLFLPSLDSLEIDIRQKYEEILFKLVPEVFSHDYVFLLSAQETDPLLKEFTNAMHSSPINPQLCDTKRLSPILQIISNPKLALNTWVKFFDAKAASRYCTENIHFIRVVDKLFSDLGLQLHGSFGKGVSLELPLTITPKDIENFRVGIIHCGIHFLDQPWMSKHSPEINFDEFERAEINLNTPNFVSIKKAVVAALEGSESYNAKDIVGALKALGDCIKEIESLLSSDLFGRQATLKFEDFVGKYLVLNEDVATVGPGLYQPKSDSKKSSSPFAFSGPGDDGHKTFLTASDPSNEFEDIMKGLYEDTEES